MRECPMLRSRPSVLTAPVCRHGCDHSPSRVNFCPIDAKPEFSGGGTRVVSALVSR